MKNARKNLWNILLDNFINIFNLSNIALIVIFVIGKSYWFIIPLLLVVAISIVNIFIDIKTYLSFNRPDEVVHAVRDGLEIEQNFNNLKNGDELVVYPGDEIKFVGKINSGLVFVDEHLINGVTKPVKKVVGDYLRNGMFVVGGSAVSEIISFEKISKRKHKAKDTFITKRIKLLTLISSLLTLLIALVQILGNSISGSFDFSMIGQSSLLCLPFSIYIILFIYFLNEQKRLKQLGIILNEKTGLTSLHDFDALCLSKSGVITSGEYEVFKTVPLSSTAFGVSTSNINSNFAQVVSDVIKANDEHDGYFNSLHEVFDYDVSKIILDKSPLRENGFYSAAYFKGGKTFAIGEANNFDLSNLESINSHINQYQFLGYRVLVLIESKNPLKNGLIDGKCQGIGIIVLREKIRKSIADLIQYCLKNDKKVFVLSGDEKEVVSDVCLRVGVESANKIISLSKISMEQLELLVDTKTIFTDCNYLQKSSIVEQLQSKGHRVAFIGSGDNDTSALKTSDVAISLDDASESARKCSQVIIDKSFNDFDNLVNTGSKQYNNINKVLSISFAQNIVGGLLVFIFALANIFNREIVIPFNFLHLILWLIFGTYLPCIFIVFDKEKDKDIHFYRNLVANILVLITPVLIIYILQLIQRNGGGFFNIPSDYNEHHEKLITSQVANNISYLALLLSSLGIAFKYAQPFNKYRLVTFGIMIIFPLVYFVLLGFGIEVLDAFTGIDSSILTGGNYFVGAFITLICIGIYLTALGVIEVFKGESKDVEN